MPIGFSRDLGVYLFDPTVARFDFLAALGIRRRKRVPDVREIV
jgi:hypothetical protein